MPRSAPPTQAAPELDFRKVFTDSSVPETHCVSLASMEVLTVDILAIFPSDGGRLPRDHEAHVDAEDSGSWGGKVRQPPLPHHGMEEGAVVPQTRRDWQLERLQEDPTKVLEMSVLEYGEHLRSCASRHHPGVTHNRFVERFIYNAQQLVGFACAAKRSTKRLGAFR